MIPHNAKQQKQHERKNMENSNRLNANVEPLQKSLMTALGRLEAMAQELSDVTDFSKSIRMTLEGPRPAPIEEKGAINTGVGGKSEPPPPNLAELFFNVDVKMARLIGKLMTNLTAISSIIE